MARRPPPRRSEAPPSPTATGAAPQVGARLPTLAAKQRLRALGLMAKKSWGQHFLHDARVLSAIVQAEAIAAGEGVLELGAGLGALTEALLGQGARVTAVERDRDLAPLLMAQLAPAAAAPAQLQVLEADAARLDYAALAQQNGAPLRVFGNLPYQISSRILVGLADAAPHVRTATVLVQREVAERLAAAAGSRTYGLLSVLVQRSFDAQLLLTVPPGAFSPPPKVSSAVVHLRRRLMPVTPLLPGSDAAEQDAQLVAAARAAFAARRKTLVNALAVGLKVAAAKVLPAVQQANLAPGCRAETLPLAAFAALGAALAQAGLLPAEKLAPGASFRAL